MKIDFCNPEKSDINSLKELWLSSFDEDKKACDLFFEKCFSTNNTYVAKYNDKIVSSLYIIESNFSGHKAHYLCGAATHKDFRKQGIMGSLIEFALNCAEKKGDEYSFLFPANDNLYNYYKKFGYKKNCSAFISEFMRDDLISLKELKFNSNNILIQNNDFKKFSAEYYSIYNIKSVGSNNYFALFEENGNTAEVFYFDFKENNFKNMVNDILQNTKAEHFIFTHNRLFNNAQKIRYGMVKPLKSGQAVPTDIYIGITLN